MSLFNEYVRNETRRQFFARGKNALGFAALASLMGPGMGKLFGEESAGISGAILPHFPAKVKNVIYLHMVGGPSQMDLLDYKPVMQDWFRRT